MTGVNQERWPLGLEPLKTYLDAIEEHRQPGYIYRFLAISESDEIREQEGSLFVSNRRGEQVLETRGEPGWFFVTSPPGSTVRVGGFFLQAKQKRKPQ